MREKDNQNVEKNKRDILFESENKKNIINFKEKSQKNFLSMILKLTNVDMTNKLIHHDILHE